MTDEQTAQPDPTAPTTEPTTDPRTQAKTPSPWRTRRWLVGGTLVAIGLAAGGGTTYAFTSMNNDGVGNGTSVIAGAPAGAPSGRPTGAPPGGAAGPGSTADSQPT